MAALDLSTFDFALKELYTAEKLYELVYKKNPLFAMLPKMEKFVGDVLPVPVVFGNPTGISAQFANAQTNNNPTKGIKFNLVRKKYYGVVKIDHETLQASKDDAGAFLRAKTTEIDGVIHQVSRALAIQAYGSGSGTRGQLDATTTIGSTVLLLRDIATVTNFEVGMILKASATDGGGAVRGGSLTIAGIDRQLGTLTMTGILTAGIGAITVNDFISLDGDYDQVATGMAGWLPSAAPSATAFFGVDRTTDSTRLAGVRYDATGVPLEEAVVELISRVEREGGAPDYIFMNHEKWRALEKALGAKVQYVNPNAGGSATVGFKGLVVSGQSGPVTILADVNCPSARMYCLQMDTFKCYSLGAAPTLYDTDGLTMLRGSASDDVEIRCYAYWQIGCRAPGLNGVAII